MRETSPTLPLSRQQEYTRSPKIGSREGQTSTHNLSLSEVERLRVKKVGIVPLGTSRTEDPQSSYYPCVVSNRGGHFDVGVVGPLSLTLLLRRITLTRE